MQKAVLVIGMALYWPLLRSNYFGLLFEDSSLLTCLIFSATTIALSFAVIMARLHVYRLLGNNSLALSLLSCLGALGEAMTLLGPSPLKLIGSALIAVGFVTLTLGWTLAINSSDDPQTLTLVAVGFCISFVGFPLASEALSILRFIGSGLLCALCFTPKLGPTAPEVSLKRLDWTFVGALVLLLLIGSTMRGISSASGFSIDHNPTLQLLSIIIAILIALATHVLTKPQSNHALQLIWTGLVMLFFLGLFLASLAYPDLLSAGIDLLFLGRVFIGFFLWLSLHDILRRRRFCPVVATAACFILPEAICGLLSYSVMPFLQIRFMMPFESHLAPISLAMAFLLVIGSFVYLWSISLPNRQTSPKSQNAPSRESACLHIGMQFGLTPREIEVMELVSRGHSVKKISDILVVSTSTVQSHIKSVYRKTGVHSRQELIDSVDSYINP